MIKFFWLLFCLSFSLLNAQKLTDEDLTDTQIDFLFGLDDQVGINYQEEGIKGFYKHFKGKKHIRIHGNTDPKSKYYNYTSDISLLGTLPDLEVLRFSRCVTTDFSVLKKARKLNSLHISYHEGLIDLKTIFKITQLEELSLSSSKHINTPSIQGIEKLSKLKKLSLRSVLLSDLSGISKISSPIKEISIGFFKVENIGDWSSLTALYSFESFSSDLNDTDFIKNNEGLEYITILNSNIRVIDLATKNIKWLSVLHCNTSDLGNIKELSSLETLSLKDNNISDINDLKFLQKLKVLNLDQNNITEVCSLNKNINLETLDISENPIDDLSCLSSLPNLKKLSAEYTCFCNPATIEELKEGVNCNSFERVLLWGINHLLYLVIGVGISFFLIIFLKKRVN